MPKTRISITVETDLLAQIDERANERNENRSQCIERMCMRMVGDTTNQRADKVEFFKLAGPLSFVINSAVYMLKREDQKRVDLSVEMSVRCDPADIEQLASLSHRGPVPADLEKHVEGELEQQAELAEYLEEQRQGIEEGRKYSREREQKAADEAQRSKNDASGGQEQ